MRDTLPIRLLCCNLITRNPDLLQFLPAAVKLCHFCAKCAETGFHEPPILPMPAIKFGVAKFRFETRYCIFRRTDHNFHGF